MIHRSRQNIKKNLADWAVQIIQIPDGSLSSEDKLLMWSIEVALT